MKNRNLVAASALAIAGICPTAFAQSDDTALQDVIIVTGSSMATDTDLNLSPDAGSDLGPDVASLITRIPGGGLIDNGALSGQVEYRGMFGDRINVRIDGQSIASGGPNLMDPPLHYAPPALVDRLVVDRGISPVRNGPGIGGGVNAIFKTVDFADSTDWSSHHDFTAAARSADASHVVGGIAGASNDQFRIHGLASHEQGGDMAFGDGDIASSEHERFVYGIGGGVRVGRHELGLDLRRQETGDTGNPPFPMDIRYFDTDVAKLTYKSAIGEARISARVGWSDVEHAMTNFHLRPAPADMMRYRETFASASTLTVGGEVAFPVGDGTITIGADTQSADRNVRITNPNNASFFVESLPRIEDARTGAFVEWTGTLMRHNVELGARADQHDQSADQSSLGSAVPMGAQMLAMAFNQSERSWDATTTDLVARIWRDASEGLTVRGNLARKQRAPTFLQTLSWLPTSASAGLADGNIYIGNRGLEPETAWILEAGLDWATDRLYARPTLWYRTVDDYIQGTPFDPSTSPVGMQIMMVSAMNGDSTPLVWTNVDARIYGFDMDAGLALSDRWRVDGTLTWLKGERRDADDSLYRITPPHISLTLTHDHDKWSASFETVAYAEQSDVSFTNNEQITPGHVRINLSADWRVTDGMRLSTGIDNILNHTWRDHLGGYNRIMNSDVAVGDRLPGPGRSVFIRLQLAG